MFYYLFYVKNMSGAWNADCGITCLPLLNRESRKQGMEHRKNSFFPDFLIGLLSKGTIFPTPFQDAGDS